MSRSTGLFWWGTIDTQQKFTLPAPFAVQNNGRKGKQWMWKCVVVCFWNTCGMSCQLLIFEVIWDNCVLLGGLERPIYSVSLGLFWLHGFRLPSIHPLLRHLLFCIKPRCDQLLILNNLVTESTDRIYPFLKGQNMRYSRNRRRDQYLIVNNAAKGARGNTGPLNTASGSAGQLRDAINNWYSTIWRRIDIQYSTRWL